MTPVQLRMARSALRLSVRELAALAGVSFMTVNRFETEKGGLQHSSAEAIRRALEAQGVQLLESGQTAKGVGISLAAPSFKAFIASREVTGDPQGDFVRDARADRTFSPVSSWAELREYIMMRSGGWSPAIEAARLVWNEYAERFGYPRASDDEDDSEGAED